MRLIFTAPLQFRSLFFNFARWKKVLYMISRRQLRIKALAILYACFMKESDDLESAEQELMLSIRKNHDLFHYLLLLLIALSDLARERIGLAAAKKMPSPEDLHPNRRFADNRVITQLRQCRELHDHALATPALWTRKDKLNSMRSLSRWLATRGLSWDDRPEMVRIIFNEMTRWEGYMIYMESDEESYKTDRRFIRELISWFLPFSEGLAASLEEQSVYWNDDLPYVSVALRNVVGKLKEQENGTPLTLPGPFANDDDEHFVKTLLRKAILNSEKNSALIDAHTTNWEVERIALMDKLVMQLAITELTEFSEVPVKVTLNEYIEIAKEYCTAKSSTFVNGILDKIVRNMRAGGLIRKSGKGLIGEPEEQK